MTEISLNMPYDRSGREAPQLGVLGAIVAGAHHTFMVGPLHVAAKAGLMNLVEMLLEAGATWTI